MVGGAEKDEKSLSLLRKLLTSLGDTADCSKVLRGPVRDAFEGRSGSPQ
jgi:hypothetical protein